tara:strand:- start:6623 stop:7141 length:519 start_codon:yes stop_codon:yes gene_type:complete
VSKTLLLLRHAKSSWSAPAHSDFERPLNRRGERSAAVIGIMMKQEKIAPDLILCSSARRTLQTRDIIRPYLPRNCPVEETSRIYEAGVREIFSVLSELPENVEKTLLIGHNPGLQQLTLSLCGAVGGEELFRVQEKFPTGALATIELAIDTWNDIASGKGRLRQFVAPKDLV